MVCFMSTPGVADGWGLPRQDDSDMHYVMLCCDSPYFVVVIMLLYVKKP